MNTPDRSSPAFNDAANSIEETLYMMQGIAAMIRRSEAADVDMGNAAWAIERMCGQAQDLVDALVRETSP